MRCPRCGAGLIVNSRFCNGCGAPIGYADPAPIPEAPQRPSYASQPAAMPVPEAAAVNMAPARARPRFWAAMALILIVIAGSAAAVGSRWLNRQNDPTRLAQAEGLEGVDFQSLPRGPDGQIQGRQPVTDPRNQPPAGGPNPAVNPQTGEPLPGAPVLAPGQLGPDGQPVPNQPRGFLARLRGQPVVTIPQNDPTAPSNPTLQQPRQLQPDNPTLQPPRQPPAGATPVAVPAPNRGAEVEFDRYLEWLRAVELGGQVLGDQITAEAGGVPSALFDGLANGDEDFGQARFVNAVNTMSARVDAAIRDYTAQVARRTLNVSGRAVPVPVPDDCRQLDRAFMELTASQVGGLRETTALLVDGMSRALGGDEAGARRVVGNLTSRLRILDNLQGNQINALNAELKRISEARGIPVKFEFKTSNRPSLTNVFGLGL